MRETGVTESVAEFRIDEERPRPGTVVLAVEGDVDLHVAAELRDHMAAAIDWASSVVLDLSGVSFVDSTALGILVGAMKRLRTKGGQLRVVAPRTELRRIFEITLLDRVLELDASRASALAATASPEGSEGR